MRNPGAVITSIFSKAKNVSSDGMSFEQLLAPHVNVLYRQANLYVGNPHDAEDLIQDLFVELYPKTNVMNTIESLKPWLMRCLYYRFVDTYRKVKRNPSHIDIDDNTKELGLESLDAAESDVLQSEIVTLLENLSAEQRAVVSLHDIEGYKLAEISAMLEQPLSTVKSHLRRARLLLKTSPALQPFAPQ